MWEGWEEHAWVEGGGSGNKEDENAGCLKRKIQMFPVLQNMLNRK